jgi:hypothetical protein
LKGNTVTTTSLASIVHESEQALAEAIAAQEKASKAAQKADAAQAAADRERDAANVRYLGVLEQEHESARTNALDVQAEARAALEAAVTKGGEDVFTCYRDWVTASLDAWGVDAALSEQRYRLGRPGRDAIAPTFSFSYDIAAIVDHHALVLQEVVIERNRDRRNAFLNGKEAS